MNAGDEPPDLVDAGRRVRAAVDVHEPLEVGEVGRLVRADRRPRAPPARRRAMPSGSGRSSPSGSLGRPGAVGRGRPQRAHRPIRRAILPGPCDSIEIRLLEGPNVYRLEPVVKVEVAVGRRRTWYGQRSPGRHALVQLGRRRPGARLAAPDRGARRLGPAPAGRPRRGPRRRRGPSLVRPGPLDRDVSAGRARSGPHSIAEAALALAERDVSPARRAHLTGAQERLARALDRRGSPRPGRRRRPGSATPTGGSRSSRSPARTARAPSPG